jgi:carboxyl-terminal processing protease
MTLRFPLALLLALVLPVAHAQAPAAQGDEGHKSSTLPLKATSTQTDAAQLSARFLTRFHYDAKPLDDVMSAKIYKAYFDMLDGEKVFFTQADMARFEPLKTKFDDAFWN